MKLIDYDIIIVGAGPAGLTAAVYASRANLKVLMLEKETPGGKVMKTGEVENWPGIKHIDGPTLAIQMFEHSTAFGAIYEYGNVVKIEDLGHYKEVICEDGKVYTSIAVIVATGTKEKLIGIPGEVEFYGRGVSYCAVCDGALAKNKVVAVIGGGNSALEEGLYLTRFVSEVHVIHRRLDFNAEEKIIQTALKNPKMIFHLECETLEILGDKFVKFIKFKDKKTNKETILEVAAVFPFIGFNPESECLIHHDVLNTNKYVEADNDMKTKVNGIFAAGDVIVKNLRQIVTATGDGAIAAQNAVKYVESIKED